MLESKGTNADPTDLSRWRHSGTIVIIWLKRFESAGHIKDRWNTAMGANDNESSLFSAWRLWELSTQIRGKTRGGDVRQYLASRARGFYPPPKNIDQRLGKRRRWLADGKSQLWRHKGSRDIRYRSLDEPITVILSANSIHIISLAKPDHCCFVRWTEPHHFASSTAPNWLGSSTLPRHSGSYT